MHRNLVSKPLESERIEVPLPIQTYLWGQTSIFLKPNLNKKSYGHVCVAFEKIICENRVCDLPPNLSSSINTIPRWHFVHGALPFVLNCCAALLSNRAQRGNTDRLTVAETKLLYTLHWILMKAPEEVENYAGKLYPLSTVELFVQAVVPFVNCIQEQDLTFRLEDGLELWQALWEFRAPPSKSFTSPVVFGCDKTEGDKTSIGHSSRRSYGPGELPDGTTFFDLAVLKCLMLPDWHEEGQVWGLNYILKYLENEHNEEVSSKGSSSNVPSLGNEQLTRSGTNVANSTTDGEAEVSIPERPTKLGISNVPNVDKLKRFYGFSSQQEDNPASVQRRLSLKDGLRRIRNVSVSSNSSLFDTLSTMANLKSLELEDNNVDVANGAKEFLDEFGCLKKSVFLDVVCQIASQSSNVRVCDLVLSVLEYILDKNIIKRNVTVSQKDSPESIPSDAEAGVIGSAVKDSAKQNGKVNSSAKLPFHHFFPKVVICVIKVVCALGCSYGCGKGIRGVAGKNLRAKAITMLTKLHEIDQSAFKTCLKSYFEDEDVELVTNFLHALLGFCTMTLESKSNQKKMGNLFKEKRGVVGVIIDCVFTPYISKLLEFNLEEISNVTLYGQVRQLVKYVKEFAGGTFFRVVFSGLLKASGTPQKRSQGIAHEPKPSLSTTDSETATQPRTPAVEKVVTPKTPRKHFFPKFSKSTSSADGSPTGNSEFPFEASPTTPLARRKVVKRPGKKGNALEESFSAEEDFQPTNSIDRRRKSLMKKFLRATGRKKADEMFTNDMRKTGAGLLTLSRVNQGGVEYTSIPVNVKEIRDGMMMFSMLLESSLPGSVPDPHIVAGILELKAPAIARGAILLECAHFVQRCNKGLWPSWLLSSHPSTRRGKGGFGALVRNAIAVSRRNVRIKHEAGLMFYKWAVAIGERLEQIETRMTSTSESKEIVDPSKQVEEDFLDEGTLDEDTRKCPHALKMVACQLLLEITAFLRESHSSLARKAENQRQRNKSIAFSRGSRRSTQKITAFGGGLGEHRDAVTSGPAERLRHVSYAMVSPVVTLSVPEVQVKQDEGEKLDQKLTASVIKVDGNPGNGNEEPGKQQAPSRKRFSALFSNSEKKRKLLKPANTERKGSISAARLYKKLPRAHTVVGRVTSDGSDNSDVEEDEVTKFPWLKAVAMVSGSTNFLCEHRDVCPPGCIRRQTQSCAKFMSALKAVYSSPVTQVVQNKSKKSEGDKGRQCKLSTKELTIKEKEKRDKIMITYIGEKSKKSKFTRLRTTPTSEELVRNLFKCPMSVLIKGALVLEPSLMLDIIPLAWELLLSPLEELVSTAAAVFLIASLHLKDVVEKMLHKELTCDSCEHQVKSLMRYGVLWRSRYYVWPCMEAGAKFILRIPLPKLDFTLPSPPVGACAPPVPDCPWDPKASMDITKNELELTEEDKKKDEAEALKIKEEKTKQRTEYNFTNTSISLEASTPVEPEEDAHIISQPITTDFWPPAMSSAIPRIIGLLDDSSVTASQTAVSEMAMRTLWECLVDDPTLLFRTFFEQITKPNKQKELVFLLNKMLVHFPILPPNAGTILFNHLVGMVLFYSRRSQPCSEDAIALILSGLMWKIVPSVPKLYLKDLKYSARKEHCERTLMVTANTPGTKKIVIACPTLNTKTENEKITVREDMTFEHLLQFCTAKWSLDNPLYRLLDVKSGQILEGKHLVRDIYAFKKGFPYPQLKLQLYDEQKGYAKRQEQAFTSKLAEVGRLALTQAILDAVQNWHHVSFLHSELSKQIAFPRKALDADFALYEGGIKGMHLSTMDGIHKRMWIKLLSKLFDSMTSAFPWGDNDLHLFLNVINGALLLQCEDSSMLRFCLSTLINAAIKFSDIFAIDGYHHILPTLILLYSHHESNDIVCNAVKFVISQFYSLHQKPFLLQLFASIEPILLTENVNKMPEHSDDVDESNMILPKCLFAILSSLEKDVPDSLDILALVDAEKPLKPLDSCYEGKLDSESECKIDIAIRLCVTVVAYSPESIRATQMLVVLSSILPYYLEYVKNYDEVAQKKESNDELTTLSSLQCSIQVLLKSCNSLRRPFLKNKGISAAKKKVREGSTGSVTSFTTSHENLRQSKAVADDDDRDVDSIDQQFKPFLNKFSTQDEGEQVLDSLYEFRTPRNAILIIASEFISTSKKRLHEMNQKNASQNADLSLDSESIQVLCNIAHTLLKLALTDTVSLESTGLQKFMLQALPNIDWSAEEVIPALNLILKRINITFTKITDKPDLMNFFWPYPLLLHRSDNWNVTEIMLKGLYLTISRHKAVAALPYTKAVVATCMRLILREQSNESEAENVFNFYPPPCLSFSQLVVKLAARLMFSSKDKYSLKDLCGGTVVFGNSDRTLRVLVHILLPLCIRLGTGNKDQPRASKSDVSYAVSCLLNIIVTPLVTLSSSARRLSSAIMLDDVVNMSPPSFVQRVLPRQTDSSGFSPSIYNAAYLGLKILIICFPDFLSNEWRTIAAVLKEVVLVGAGNESLWEFLDFIVLHRTPLYLLLLPIFRTKVPLLQCTSAHANTLKESLLKQLRNPPHPTPSKGAWMQRFIQELGVLTGSGQNDMFHCRNPTESNRPGLDIGADTESLSDFEIIPEAHADELQMTEHQEHKRKISLVSIEPPGLQEGNEKTHNVKSLRKKVSFDKAMPLDLGDVSLEEASAVDRPTAPKQKRSLHRQEFAVDLESPISNKNLSMEYPITSHAAPKSPDDDVDNIVDTTHEAGGQSKGKKRRLGKNRKLTPDSSNGDSVPSIEMENVEEMPKDVDDKTQPDVSKINDQVAKVSTKTCVSVPPEENSGNEKGCEESDSTAVCDQMACAESEKESPKDGSMVHLIPQEPEDDPGVRNLSEVVDVVPWSRNVLDNSKETSL